MSDIMNLQSLVGHFRYNPIFEGSISLDQDVLKELPADAVTISANSHGFSTWSTTACIDTELIDGKHKKYFFKTVKEKSTEADAALISGEKAAMLTLQGTIPGRTPNLISLISDPIGKPLRPSILYEFLELEKIEKPDPEPLCELLVKLHKESRSPTNKFGFDCSTPFGRVMQATGSWNGSWKEFFVQLIKHAMDKDREVNGLEREIEELKTKTLNHIIPRLIEPLETEERSIKPCLIHGDLWHGNTGVKTGTKDVVLFDAGCYYAHHEMEMASWEWPHNKLGDPSYRATYLEKYGEGAKSEPEEEWEYRIQLYSVYYFLILAINRTIKEGEGAEARELARERMQYLVKEFADYIKDREAEGVKGLILQQTARPVG